MKLPQEFDLHALEVFVMTVELGGMSQCAVHMQVTQSAVSQTIAKLEVVVGIPLFDRTMRPLGLTAGGKSLFDRGQKLIALARSTYDNVRAGSNLPIANITAAMSFSLANQLTAPIMQYLGDRAERWIIRSGISREHQSEFLGRDIDILVTGSFNLQHRDAVEIHPVFEESFVLVFPTHYHGPIDIAEIDNKLPFVRFSHLTGMGQQIERQMVRMKMKRPNGVQVESSQQQLALVASGYGWAITSPVCLAAAPELLPHLRIEPMHRGRFARQVQVISRVGELGELPAQIARLATQVLQQQTFPSLIDAHPWLQQELVWPVLSEGAA